MIPLVCSRTSVGERARKHCSWTASWDQRERPLQRRLEAEAVVASPWEEAEERREQRSLFYTFNQMAGGGKIHFKCNHALPEGLPWQRGVLLAGMSAAESPESTGSVGVRGPVAGFPELEYKDWLCCWWGCVGTGCDSAAASEEAAKSLWWWREEEEECDAP